MNQFPTCAIETLPEENGVFVFLNESGKTIFVGVAENIRAEISRILSEKNLLTEQVRKIEVLNSREKDLIKLYARTVCQKKPFYNLNLSRQSLFPFLKITREKYPRLLITRKILNDNAEYFGAFLPETKSRFLLDFLIKTFRLRSCAIEIEGNFPVPCTQFYEKKCVAPCVESLCEKAAYDERVNLLRIFLANDREEFEKFVRQKIDLATDVLDFETAARRRDLLESVRTIWQTKEMNLRLEDAVDTFEIEERVGRVFVFLISQRGRKILGQRAFVFSKIDELSAPEFLSQILWQIYEFYVPKEIRVPTDFADRKFLSKILSNRANHSTKINIVAKETSKKTTASAFVRTKFEYDFNKIKPELNLLETQEKLKITFGLSGKVRRIEAFDVAHISGTNFVAAKTVWENGKFLANEYEFWLLNEKNELSALKKGIALRIEKDKIFPDLFLIDGGKPQLSAALKVLDQVNSQKFSVIAVVKPPDKHNDVSHFINENGKTIFMKADSGAFQTLVRLRDEVHNLSNRVHRLRRDSTHFYELANVLPSLNENERRNLLQTFGSLRKLKAAERVKLEKILGSERGSAAFFDLQNLSDSKIEPLIVPIRFTDENGNAEDLQPLSGVNLK